MRRTILVLLFLAVPCFLFPGEVRVMTWNLQDMDIFDGAGSDRIPWQLNTELGIAEEIREVDPDLLFITEAPSYVELEAFVERNRLDYEVIHFRQQSGRRDFADSMAVLHRLPVQSSRLETPIPDGSSRSEATAYLDWSYRGLVVVDFGDFHLVGVHLKSPWDGRERSYNLRDAQAREILDFIDGISGPVVVLGDFNDSPGRDAREDEYGLTDTIALLETELIRAGGSGITQEKGLNLDHIFVRDAATGTRQVRATDWELSDHRPVWTDILF